jgi:glutamate formiminotransferase
MTADFFPEYMKMKLLECVPNISEGRDQEKIASLAEEVKKYKGVKLLDYSSDKDHHRSVFTFIGDPEAVKDTAFSLVMKALDLIDMREHKGGHPRLGAADVVPFVPIQGMEMEEAVQIAHEFGKGLGRRGIPVFFYEEAATHPDRNCRTPDGNPMKALPILIQNPELRLWEPDTLWWPIILISKQKISSWPKRSPKRFGLKMEDFLMSEPWELI